MVILGNTVLNVALPTLVRELDATSTQLQWMVDSYALVFPGLLPTAGALGDRFGRKGALQIGLFVFGAASLLSTFATEADHLVATRALMGVGAAFVMPATLSILTNVFPSEERVKAIAIWAGLAGSGAAIGPIAGGWLLEHFGWASVFFLNIPLVVVAVVAGWFLVPRSRDAVAAGARPPWRGAVDNLIMSSLPLGEAGVGSAANDTTRELGGALGVAVLGSLLASSYASNVAGAADGLPGPAAVAAKASLGGALGAGRQGDPLPALAVAGPPGHGRHGLAARPVAAGADRGPGGRPDRRARRPGRHPRRPAPVPAGVCARGRRRARP
jgi:MFS family permease